MGRLGEILSLGVWCARARSWGLMLGDGSKAEQTVDTVLCSNGVQEARRWRRGRNNSRATDASRKQGTDGLLLRR